MGWLYALHVRSSIARGRVWQAEYMLANVRNHVLALACLRHDLPAAEGRGVDRLPQEVTAPIADSLVRSLDTVELARAFRIITEAFITEIACVDGGLSQRLSGPLLEMTEI
jgi:hypothetical protein